MLEMLLVVGIMSALALSATLFVGNQDDQQRFEETNQRLQAIRRAVVGDETMPAGQYVPEGFVAENGVLPDNIDALLAAQPTGYSPQDFVEPIFDSSPDGTTGLNNDLGTSISDETTKLMKGWRAANLLAVPGSEGKFGDAWGAASTAANNYEWGYTKTPLSLNVTSKGRNRSDGGAGYDLDVTDIIAMQHWSSPVSSLTVTLVNGTNDDLYLPGTSYHVSLLVFQNTGSGGQWRRFTSVGVECLDGTGDGLVDDDGDTGTPPITCPSSVALSFSPTGCNTCTYSANDTRVPYGRHLLVAVKDTDNNSHNDTDELYDRDTAVAEVQPIHLPITCRPSGCPHATLILR